MTTRFNISDHSGVQRLLTRLDLTLAREKFWPRYNVSPMTALWAIYGKLERAHLSPVEWALVPLWAKADQFPRPLTVARAETAWERASFKSLIRRYRVIVPVNGLYLFSRASKRRAWHLRRDDGEALGIGGIRQYSADGIMQICVLTCEDTATCPAGGERFPVIVQPGNFHDWLHSEKRDVIDAMMQPGPGCELVVEEVSSAVIDPAFENAECIVPLDAAP